MIENLGIKVDADSGFDIVGHSAIAYALIKVNTIMAFFMLYFNSYKYTTSL
jgi:hypothetical protein